MKILWKSLLLIIIGYVCYFPIFSIEEPMDELGSEIYFFLFTPLLLFLLGKLLMKLKVKWLIPIILISLTLPDQTNEIYEEYQQYQIYNQSFSNESFHKQFFGPDIAYSSFIIKNVSYKNHHVYLKMNFEKSEGETEEEFLYYVSEFVEDYSPYHDLHYLTAYVNYEGDTYIFSKIPLKKQEEPYKEENESLKAVKNSLIK